MFLPERDDERVVENLEDGDEAAAHGEAEDAADVGDEPDRRHLLVALHLLENGMCHFEKLATSQSSECSDPNSEPA